MERVAKTLCPVLFKDYRRFSDTSNNNQTLVKELENKLTEEEKQRKNLETQVRTLEEKLNLYSEKVKQAEVTIHYVSSPS